MNLNIKNNNTLYRKSTYETLITRNKHNITNEKSKYSNKIVELPDSMGMYLRPENHTEYIDNFVYIRRTIQINSSDRNLTYFKSPFNFTTYVANNQIINSGPLQQVISNSASPMMKTDPKYDVYLTPRIGLIIPNIYKINLNKIIIPNFFTINQKNIVSTDPDYILYNNIGIFLMNYLLSSTININDEFFVSSSGVFIIVVNIVINEKINIIINYDPSTVVSYIYNITTVSDIYQYKVDSNSPSKYQRVLHLNIKELNDNFDYSTSKILSTFRLIPKSIKNKFLYADTKNIQKIFDDAPIKLNKFSIQLTDSNNIELKIYFLDYDIINQSNACCCSYEQKIYSCPCNYILHPLNPKYQIYLFFNFQYKYMVINNKINNI